MKYIQNFRKVNKQLCLVCTDIIMLGGAFVLACGLFGKFPNRAVQVVLVIGIQVFVFLRFGLYKAVLRYASVDFLVTVLKAVTVASFVVVLFLYIAKVDVPVQVLIVHWLLSLAVIGGSRFVVRYYFELKLRFQNGKRVLVYGAGDMGSIALRQLLLNKAEYYSPVGFIDDDKKKNGTVVRGRKVLGCLDDLTSIVESQRIQEVVVAISEIDNDKLRTVVNICKQRGIVCRIIPCFSRLVQLEPDIRNIELADLMRRIPRDLDKNAVEKSIRNKVVLITGAAGSIGSEIVRQCLTYKPKLVLALDQSEFGLYALKEEIGNVNVKFILCDTTNLNGLENVFKLEKPEIIFHAAAYKHVPLLESNIAEGVRNNVVSTRNLCTLAEKYQLSCFVMISTDKAVKPSNIMGATKRVCELIVHSFAKKCDTKFVSVRFGNVLGSSGSVIPKFMDQIRQGGPVTVTHPDATRYFMLIEEAVQLVLQAFSIGCGGEIFILDMGKPVKIADMAEDLIYLMGRQPHKDVKIHFSGLRPGEKVHEELFNDEIEKQTKFKEIMVGKSSTINWEELRVIVDQLVEAATTNNGTILMSKLRTLVPEGCFYGGHDGKA